MSHGHVTPNPDGSRARCGGPAICKECALEKARLDAADTSLGDAIDAAIANPTDTGAIDRVIGAAWVAASKRGN